MDSLKIEIKQLMNIMNDRATPVPPPFPPENNAVKLPVCCVCHESITLSRTMMCDSCQVIALYLGRELLSSKSGKPIAVHFKRKGITTMYRRVDWSDYVAPWILGGAVLYFAAQLIRAFVTHAPGFGG